MRFYISLLGASLISAAAVPVASSDDNPAIAQREELSSSNRADPDTNIPPKVRCPMTPDKCTIVGVLDSLPKMKSRVPFENGCWLGWFTCLTREENIQWHIEEGANYGYPWMKEWNDSLTEEEKKKWRVDKLELPDGSLERVNKLRKMERALTEEEFRVLMEEARALNILRDKV